MLKPNELRIGNYVFALEEVCITSVDNTGINRGDNCSYGYPSYYCSLGTLCGIPLTPEWLERLGFGKMPDYFPGEFEAMYEDEIGNTIDFQNGKYKWWLVYRYSDYVELKYVHQLQNLYFALTGQELEIKQTVCPKHA